jgi:hypothetical protein
MDRGSELALVALTQFPYQGSARCRDRSRQDSLPQVWADRTVRRDECAPLKTYPRKWKTQKSSQSFWGGV